MRCRKGFEPDWLFKSVCCPCQIQAHRLDAAHIDVLQAKRNPKLARVVAALQQATLLQYWTVRCSAAAGLAKV